MENSGGDISDFRISGKSLMKENGHNSRTSDNIEIKLGPVTKLNNRNKTMSKEKKRTKKEQKTITSCQQVVTLL